MNIFNPLSWFRGAATQGEFWLKGILLPLGLIVLLLVFVFGTGGFSFSFNTRHKIILRLIIWALLFAPLLYMTGMAMRRMWGLGLSAEHGALAGGAYGIILFVFFISASGQPSFLLIPLVLYVLIGLIPGNKGVRRPVPVRVPEPHRRLEECAAESKAAETAAAYQAQKIEEEPKHNKRNFLAAWIFGASTQGLYWLELIVSVVLWVPMAYLGFLLATFLLPVSVFLAWLIGAVVSTFLIGITVLRRARGIDMALAGWAIWFVYMLAVQLEVNGQTFGFPDPWSWLAFFAVIALGLVPGYTPAQEKSPQVYVPAPPPAAGYGDIIFAAADNDIEAVKEILQHRPRAVRDVAPDTGNTALHIAAWNGYAELAELLMQHGADVSARNKAGLTPEELWNSKYPSAAESQKS